MAAVFLPVRVGGGAAAAAGGGAGTAGVAATGDAPALAEEGAAGKALGGWRDQRLRRDGSRWCGWRDRGGDWRGRRRLKFHLRNVGLRCLRFRCLEFH